MARLGGDEFVVLLTDLDDARGTAAGVAAQLLAAIGMSFDIEGKTFALGASIGIALYYGASVSASQLMSQADIAMYQAKRPESMGFVFSTMRRNWGRKRAFMCRGNKTRNHPARNVMK